MPGSEEVDAQGERGGGWAGNVVLEASLGVDGEISVAEGEVAGAFGMGGDAIGGSIGGNDDRESYNATIQEAEEQEVERTSPAVDVTGAIGGVAMAAAADVAALVEVAGIGRGAGVVVEMVGGAVKPAEGVAGMAGVAMASVAAAVEAGMRVAGVAGVAVAVVTVVVNATGAVSKGVIADPRLAGTPVLLEPEGTARAATDKKCTGE